MRNASVSAPTGGASPNALERDPQHRDVAPQVRDRPDQPPGRVEHLAPRVVDDRRRRAHPASDPAEAVLGHEARRDPRHVPDPHHARQVDEAGDEPEQDPVRRVEDADADEQPGQRERRRVDAAREREQHRRALHEAPQRAALGLGDPRADGDAARAADRHDGAERHLRQRDADRENPRHPPRRRAGTRSRSPRTRAPRARARARSSPDRRRAGGR